jgi:hypothetical protein
MNARRPHRPIAWWRVLLALAACFGIGFDGAVPHDMAADRVGAVSRVEIAANAVHPGDPAHFEQAEIKVHPGCVACLLQAETRTVPGPAPFPLPPLERDAHIASLVETVSSHDGSLPGPARAPPVPSLSA